MENMIVMLLNMILLCAFLVIIFGAFSGVSDKWQMRQVAREYSLIMETEGYRIPDSERELWIKLKNASDNFDYELVISLLSDVEN